MPHHPHGKDIKKNYPPSKAIKKTSYSIIVLGMLPIVAILLLYLISKSAKQEKIGPIATGTEKDTLNAINEFISGEGHFVLARRAAANIDLLKNGADDLIPIMQKINQRPGALSEFLRIAAHFPFDTYRIVLDATHKMYPALKARGDCFFYLKREENMRHCLKTGGNPNYQSPTGTMLGNTNLHLALANEEHDVVRTFIAVVEKDAKNNPLKFDVLDDYHQTPYVLAVRVLSIPDSYETLKRMLMYDMQHHGKAKVAENLNIPDNRGLTPAAYAAILGQVDILELLSQYGADLSFVSPKGKSLRDLAATPKESVAKILLEREVNPQRDKAADSNIWGTGARSSGPDGIKRSVCFGPNAAPITSKTHYNCNGAVRAPENRFFMQNKLATIKRNPDSLGPITVRQDPQVLERELEQITGESIINRCMLGKPAVISFLDKITLDNKKSYKP